jgi:hypothetical protein
MSFRLRSRRGALARALGLTDDTEIDEALGDIQVELHRYLAHLRLRRSDRKVEVARRRGRRLPGAIVTNPRPIGRPIGSGNVAVLQLHLSLATLWHRLTGRPAARAWDFYRRGAEYGPYHDFVQLVVSAMPLRIRPVRKGAVPRSVRMGVDEAKRVRSAGDEYRRRGLVDTALWEQGPLLDPLS